MTVSTTVSRISYAGNGVTTFFTFPYYFLDNADLIVILKNNLTGVETVKTITTHYTVSGAGVQAGGSITMVTAPTADETLTIYRDPAATQGTDLVENDSHPAETEERSFDRLTMIAQRLKDRIDRAVRLSDGYAAAFDPTLPADIGVNGAGRSPVINDTATGFKSAVDWPNASDIAAAGANAAAAAAAAAQLESAFFRDVVYYTTADSPVTIAGTDNGKLFIFDSSSGAITVNLPTIANVTTPFNVSFKLKNGSFPVTVNRTGTDVIDGATSKALSVAGSAFHLIADTDQAPDEWTSLTYGATGGGGSSLGINYITAFDDESTGLTNWNTYADAAAASPVDGTGGSANITLTSSGSSPLRDSQSFLITKDAANRQGQGVSYDFDIASADKAKVLAISFEYEVAGTFVSGDSSDLRMYVYDKTNAVLIQPAPYTIQGGTTGQHKFIGVFQTASNSTAYRLIFHVATVSTNAWTMKFDTVTVGPQLLGYSSPVNDWKAYTPTFTGFGTVGSSEFFYRRVGDVMQVKGFLVSGVSTAVEARVSLPSGHTSSDSTRHMASNGFVGKAAHSAVGAYSHNVLCDDNQSYFTLALQGVANGGLTSINGDVLISNGQTLALFAEVPIAGWLSTVEMSNDTDTRVVAARLYLGSNQNVLATAATKVALDTASFDTHGAFVAGSNRWVCPVPGKYLIHGTLNASGITSGDSLGVLLYKNGTVFASATTFAVATNDAFGQNESLVELVAGDYIELFADSGADANYTLNSGSGNIWLDILRLSGPSAIAASEKIIAVYQSNNGQGLNTAEIINYEDKVIDTHGIVTTGVGTWKATIPRAGYYEVTANWAGAGGALTTGTNIRKNTVVQASQRVGATTTYGALASVVLSCLAGDTIDVTTFVSAGGIALTGTASDNTISIRSI